MLFEGIGCAIHWISQKSFHMSTVSHILDDLIFFAIQSESECCGYLHHFQTVATYVGFPKHSKTVQPDTCVTVRGIEVDTNMMQDRVPQDNWTMRLPLSGVSVEGQK